MQLCETLTEADHVLGPSAAQLTLIEYANFSCPHSRRLYWRIKDAVLWYGELIRFAFRYFPNDSEDLASEAAEAAAAQGDFWQMHNLLFEEEEAGPITICRLLQFAESARLDVSRFHKDIELHAYRKRIQHDRQSGMLSGVLRAPAVFINGRLRPDLGGSTDVIEVLHHEFNALEAP